MICIWYLVLRSQNYMLIWLTFLCALYIVWFREHPTFCQFMSGLRQQKQGLGSFQYNIKTLLAGYRFSRNCEILLSIFMTLRNVFVHTVKVPKSHMPNIWANPEVLKGIWNFEVIRDLKKCLGGYWDQSVSICMVFVSPCFATIFMLNRECLRQQNQPVSVCNVFFYPIS